MSTNSKAVKQSSVLWQIIAPVKQRLYYGIFLSTLAAACALIALISSAYLIKNLLQDSPQVWPWSWTLTLIVSTSLCLLLRSTAFAVTHAAAFDLEVKLRTELSQHLSRVALGYVVITGSAVLSKIMLNDIKELHVFVADTPPYMARAYAAPLLSLLVLLYLDWRLALAALVVMVAGMLLIFAVMRNADELSQCYNQSREQVSQAVLEFVQAMPIVRTFDSGRSSFGRYQQALQNFLQSMLDWYQQSGLQARISLLVLSPIPTLLTLLWLGAYYFGRQQLDFSVWLAVLLLGTGMAEALMPYISLIHANQKAEISANRILQLQAVPELAQPAESLTPNDSSLTFENVSFYYENRTKAALEDISFSINPGSFTALVGASGAGKTTVARLIPRFWDVSAGSIKVGGVDVRDLSAEKLMQQVGFVFQENHLFSDSIVNNIRLGMPDASLEQVIVAAKAAQAHDFIVHLTNGYQTRLDERGTDLSGGQRQRISLARAILQNRPILVLDEATAFTDPENEALIMQALSALMHDKTVLMIAHRLATIRGADQILVFDQGRLVEQGNHRSLIQANGNYARLWQSHAQAQAWSIQPAGVSA